MLVGSRDCHDHAVLCRRFKRVRNRIAALLLAPVLKTEMLRHAHAVPFSVMHGMKLFGQRAVFFEACIDFPGKLHRISTPDICISVVQRRQKPHLLHVEVRRKRQIDKLIVAELRFLGKLRTKRLRLVHQTVAFRKKLFAFAVSERSINPVVHGLGASCGIDFRVAAQKLRKLCALRIV